MNANNREWPKDLSIWRDGDTYKISVPFTWLLPRAKTMQQGFESRGYCVCVGGPAVRLMPKYLRGALQDDLMALDCVNPMATRTSAGCDRGCSFCGVGTISGQFREYPEFEAKPIVIDDNFLMSSAKHFHKVIDALRTQKHVDFTQGLDARLLTPERLERLRELDLRVMRFAWDDWSDKTLPRALERVIKAGFPRRKISVYCLINFKDGLSEALHRMHYLKALKIRGYVMRYQPLDTLEKNKYVAVENGWTQEELFRFLQYWNRQRVYEHIPYGEFDRKNFLRPEIARRRKGVRND